MRRVAPSRLAAGLLATLVALVAGGLPATVTAASPDKSDVVLEFDFSGSITTNETTRTQLAASLNDIAARVDASSADLVQGDTTVSLIQFADRAADVPGCVGLHLLNDPKAVSTFADCLRKVASDYESGGSKALEATIGVGTSYANALQQAAVHLPPDAVRPVVIFFTDVSRDGPGPLRDALPVRDQLFGNRSSFALLPVGLATDPAGLAALEAALTRFTTVKGIPDCLTGSALKWPSTAFSSPTDAGTAVGDALSAATCTFSVKPRPPVVTDIRATAGNGAIVLVWDAIPPTAPVPAAGYIARCRAGDSGEWIQSNQSKSPSATIDGLANGTAYNCQVASVAADGTPSIFAAADATVTPIGMPAAPAAPTVKAGNGTIDVAVPPQTGVDQMTFQCTPDGGQSFPATATADGDNPATKVGVSNGTEYRCRAIAANAVGSSPPSELSAAVLPCNGFLQCTPTMLPIVGGGIGILLLGVLIAAFFLYRDRQRGHVVAVVDVVHTANIGHGSSLGLAFVHSPETRKVTGVVADRGRKADVRIQRLRHGRFKVQDKNDSHVVEDGERVVVLDSVGGRHSLELRAFSTNAASRVATRR
jgi:hypothetical protein